MPAVLQMWKLCLAIVAEGEGIDREAGGSRDQLHKMAAERRIRHQVVHPWLANIEKRMPCRIELNINTLVLRGQVFAVLLNVESRCLAVGNVHHGIKLPCVVAHL